MVISVEYDDGRIREFDTGAFTPTNPFKGVDGQGSRSDNYVTEFDLRVDLLEEEGLRLDIYYNTLMQGAKPDTLLVQGMGKKEDKRNPVRVPAAKHNVWGVFYLISQEEMEHVVLIMVKRCDSATVVAWRQGSQNWLINGQKFNALTRQFYTDAKFTSTNDTLLRLMARLSLIHPDVAEEDLVALTGFPFAAYEEVLDQMVSESNNAPVPDERASADDVYGDNDRYNDRNRYVPNPAEDFVEDDDQDVGQDDDGIDIDPDGDYDEDDD